MRFHFGQRRCQEPMGMGRGGGHGEEGHGGYGGGREGEGRFGGRGFGPRGGRPRMFEQGDLRYVVLKLLGAKPSHGYEIIKAVEERFGGAYAPSPGIVYPTLTLLEEQGLIAVVETEGPRKLYGLTDEGRAELERSAGDIDRVFARMSRDAPAFWRRRGARDHAGDGQSQDGAAAAPVARCPRGRQPDHRDPRCRRARHRDIVNRDVSSGASGRLRLFHHHRPSRRGADRQAHSAPIGRRDLPSGGRRRAGALSSSTSTATPFARRVQAPDAIRGRLAASSAPPFRAVFGRSLGALQPSVALAIAAARAGRAGARKAIKTMAVSRDFMGDLRSADR